MKITRIHLKNVFKRLRMSILPTTQDKEYLRWLADGGDEALRYEYDLNADSVVFDLGGYKGQWASDIYARYNCRLLVFEPVPFFAAQIKAKFKRNPKIEVFDFALGASQRQEGIYMGDDESSLYKRQGKKETIQIEDVADFIKGQNITAIDLMKINIEGGEYELLPRLLDKRLIERIKHIQVQFHNVGADSEDRMDAICSELSATHQPSYQYKFVWENWNRHDISTAR